MKSIFKIYAPFNSKCKSNLVLIFLLYIELNHILQVLSQWNIHHWKRSLKELSSTVKLLISSLCKVLEFDETWSRKLQNFEVIGLTKTPNFMIVLLYSLKETFTCVYFWSIFLCKIIFKYWNQNKLCYLHWAITINIKVSCYSHFYMWNFNTNISLNITST